MKRMMSIVDGNEAAASVAYRLNEVIAIYPITPTAFERGNYLKVLSSYTLRANVFND